MFKLAQLVDFLVKMFLCFLPEPFLAILALIFGMLLKTNEASSCASPHSSFPYLAFIEEMRRFSKPIHKTKNPLDTDGAVCFIPPKEWVHNSVLPIDGLKITVQKQILPLPPFTYKNMVKKVEDNRAKWLGEENIALQGSFGQLAKIHLV